MNTSTTLYAMAAQFDDWSRQDLAAPIRKCAVEVEALERQVEELEEEVNEDDGQFALARTRIEELEEDARRLDWLNDQMEDVRGNGTPGWKVEGIDSFESQTVRQAIDAARHS